MKDATKQYKALVFTSWYPTPEAPFNSTFTQQQVEIVEQNFNARQGERWKFTVWHQAFETDIPNRVFRDKYQKPYSRNSNESIKVFFNQGTIVSHRIPIDQADFLFSGMKATWEKVSAELGGVPDIIWCITLTGLIQASWFFEKMNIKIPLILQEHSVPLTMHIPNRHRRDSAKKYLPKAKRIVAVAERQKEEFLSLTNKAVDVLWNCVDPVFFEKIADSDFENEIVFVGRFSVQKGIMRLLKAFRQFVIINPLWKLNLVGDGSMRKEMEQYIINNALEEKVILVGMLSKELIIPYLRNSAFFVLPSFYENCPVSLLEAQACGTPSLVTINHASEKVLLEGNGIAVEDTGDGAGLLSGFIKMKACLHQYDRAKIQERAKKEFSPEVFADKFHEIMNEAIDHSYATS